MSSSDSLTLKTHP